MKLEYIVEHLPLIEKLEMLDESITLSYIDEKSARFRLPLSFLGREDSISKVGYETKVERVADDIQTDDFGDEESREVADYFILEYVKAI